MGGKTVPQHVRRKGHTQTRASPICRQYFPHAYPAKRRTTTVDEQCRSRTRLCTTQKLGTAVAEIFVDHPQSLLANGNDSLFVALTDAADATHLRVEIANAKPGQLRNTEAGGIQHFQHGAVTQSRGCPGIGLLEQLLDFLKPQIAW